MTHTGTPTSSAYAGLAGYYRYRVGDWRVTYEIDKDSSIVVVLIVAHRSKAYG